jgi:hypothetical protein
MLLPVTLKPTGKVLSSVHGFGSHFFSWDLLSDLSLYSGTISSRSVIEGIIHNAEFLMRGPFPKAGTLVRTIAIVTQLVFEHALRIRVKAETSHSPAATPTATPKGRSEAATPDSGSVSEIHIVSEGPSEGSQETRSEQSASVKAKRRDDVPGSDSGKDDGDETVASSNLVGKMNNLVSTDLENLIAGRDILLLRLSSLPPRPAPFSHFC